MKFKEYIDLFIKERALTLSPVTILNYRRELKKAAVSLGEKEMSEIIFQDMKQYFINLQGSGVNSYSKQLYKHGTLVQHYITLHVFFENAYENEIIIANPMAKLKRPKPRKEEIIEEALFYSVDEVKYILECIEKEPLMWRALTYFVIDSGCRCGEAMALKWNEINFDNGSVNICRNIQYTPERGTYICSPKNGKNRKIFLNRVVLDILEEWKQDQQSITTSIGIESNGYCFTKRNGEIMMPGCFNSYLGRFGRKYNLRGIHPHALRHTMASISILNGADIVSVSKKLGHSKVSITLNVYSHANQEAQKHANDVLAKAIYN